MKSSSKIFTGLKWLLVIVLFFGSLTILKDLLAISELNPVTKTEKFIHFVGIFLSMFVVLGIHELGHLITGLIKGFKFDLYVVGPLGIKRENNKIKIYLNKNLGYYGGVAGTSPKENHPDNAKKFAQILLAGPITSLLFSVLCFLLVNPVGKPFGIVLFTAGAISLGIFIVTTIPARTGMFFTDRKRYQRLVKPGKEQDVELAILRIMGSFSKDNSYKDISQHDIETLISDELPFFKFYGLFNLICFQLENKGMVEKETLEKYEELSKGISKKTVAAWDKEIKSFAEKYSSNDNSSL